MPVDLEQKWKNKRNKKTWWKLIRKEYNAEENPLHFTVIMYKTYYIISLMRMVYGNKSLYKYIQWNVFIFGHSKILMVVFPGLVLSTAA